MNVGVLNLSRTFYYSDAIPIVNFCVLRSRYINNFLKSPTAYYLLLLYVVLVFKPALPVISNLVAHAFAGVAHVANVHAKYGSNHVQNEVGATTQKENKKNQHQAELKQQFQVVCHVVT